VENCRPYRNIAIVRAGLWNSDAELKIHNPGEKSWAFRVSESSEPGGDFVSGITIPQLLAGHNAPEIDILKLDIEGAEETLFSGDSQVWIETVRAIVIEVHGKRCDEIVHRALAGQNFKESRQGEKLVFTRILR
jgi:FkbM family methyltransferase